jgi:hypothetical protein
MIKETTLTEADFVNIHEYYHKLFSHPFRLRKAETEDPLQPLMHPAYGLADETRKKVLQHAAENTVREAAEKHNVAQSTIYRWRALLAGG